jgi:uncharacterized Fe-S center protein
LGAAIKNLGMGCASRAGKLDQHSVAHPKVQGKSCRSCGLCFDHCPAGAIVPGEGRVVVDDARCIGCGECLVVCKFGAMRVRWDDDYRRIQEKIAEYALFVRRRFKRKAAFLNFLIRVTKDCDCMARGEAPIVDDIGILASSDPVAVDQASADLVLKAAGGRDVFRRGYDIDWSIQLKYARTIGLGSTRYALKILGAGLPASGRLSRSPGCWKSAETAPVQVIRRSFGMTKKIAAANTRVTAPLKTTAVGSPTLCARMPISSAPMGIDPKKVKE